MTQPKVKKSWWAKLGKAIHILVVLAFFMPFFGVSCADKNAPGQSIDIITMSGTDMAFGCEPGGMIAEAKNNPDMRGGDMDLKLEKVKVEPLAIVALLCAVGGVLAAFLLKGKKAVQGSLVASALCIGAVLGLYFKVRGEIDTQITDQMKEGMGKSSMTADAKIESGSRMGIWIVLIGLAATAGLAAVALKKRDDETPDVVPPTA